MNSLQSINTDIFTGYEEVCRAYVFTDVGFLGFLDFFLRLHKKYLTNYNEMIIINVSLLTQTTTDEMRFKGHK